MEEAVEVFNLVFLHEELRLHGQQVLQRGQAEHAFILFIFKPLSLLAATVNRGDTNWHQR
jgi:hypothetical protein